MPTEPCQEPDCRQPATHVVEIRIGRLDADQIPVIHRETWCHEHAPRAIRVPVASPGAQR